MKAAQTSFERFEFKYLVPDSVAKELLAMTEAHLMCDDWAEGGQRITSLYLDSPDLDFLTLHTEAAPDRSKLRVRAYGDPPTDPAFFEIKRKVKRVTFKERAVVPLALVPALLRGEPVPSLKLKSAEERNTLDRFMYLMYVHQAEPQVLITYRREAFTSKDPVEGVRLTLDRDICYQSARGLTLLGDPRAWTHLCGMGNYLAEAPTLIELKFRGAAPWWVEEMVQRLRLNGSSYSKYVMAMTVEALDAEGVYGWDLAGVSSASAGKAL